MAVLSVPFFLVVAALLLSVLSLLGVTAKANLLGVAVVCLCVALLWPLVVH